MLIAVSKRAQKAPEGQKGLEDPSLQDYQAAADLRAAIRLFQRRTEDVARRHGLTPQRHALLLMIKGAPDGSERSTVTALAERLQLAQSTVTELVARAERVGLIARETDDEDARVSHLRLARRPPGASRPAQPSWCGSGSALGAVHLAHYRPRP